MGRRKTAGSSSSSSYTTENTHNHHCTDLSLGLHNHEDDDDHDRDRDRLFVKVYMEGIPIGRKLNLLANNGYDDLISTLRFMFDIGIASTIRWSGLEVGGDGNEYYDYVLTYQDKEGDWMMVGDVPWEMFLSTVQRLNITRPYRS